MSPPFFFSSFFLIAMKVGFEKGNIGVREFTKKTLGGIAHD
jgi:hypothetical protein